MKTTLKILLLSILMMSLILPVSVRMVSAEEGDPTPSTEPSEEPAAPMDITANGPAISGQTAVLIDAKSGQVLYRKNPDQQMTPAGIQKILSIYIAVQNLSDDQTITCSEDAIFGFDRSFTHVWLTPDEVIKASDGEYAAMLESANDATRVIAEGVAGDQPAFVDLMNQTVSDMGLTNTNFTNATGISEENNYSSAYDMAQITRLAITNESFLKVFGATTYAMDPTNKQSQTRYFATDDELQKAGANNYEYAIGGKTGWSQEGGYTISALAENNNMELIAVVMGCETSDQLYADTIALFNWGYSNFKTVTISRDDIGTKEVEITKDGKLWATANFTINVDFNILLKASDEETGITTDIEVRNENNPDKISAYVIIYKDGQQIAEKEMDKEIEVYDISFAATTLPKILNILDLICVGVLVIFVAGNLIVFIQKHTKLPE